MDLVNTNEYKGAQAKIALLAQRLDAAKKADVAEIRDEKAEFFQKMRETNPRLYSAFRIDDNQLSRKIHKKLTGKDVIVE